MNGTSRDDAQPSAASPPTKHAPIPPPPNSALDEQVQLQLFKTDEQYNPGTPRTGAMSISSLLTNEMPNSPPIQQTTSASSRHSNILLTASSSRPQRRKPSMDIPSPSPSLLASSKKRKREGDPSDPDSVRNKEPDTRLIVRPECQQTEDSRKSNSEVPRWIR